MQLVEEDKKLLEHIINKFFLDNLIVIIWNLETEVS